MNKTGVSKLRFLLPLLLLIVGFAQAQENQVNINGIRSGKGKIIFRIFKDSQGYEEDKPFKTIIVEKKGIITNGTIVVALKLDAGIYGITLIDDENNDGKLTKNIFGFPKEGFGFSNFYMKELKKPGFNDFKVDLRTGITKIVMQVKYL